MVSTNRPLGFSSVIIGGYTPKMSGRAVGLSVLAGSDVGGQPQFAETATVKLESPTYLIAHPSKPWLFVVTEDEPALVNSFVIGDDHGLSLVSSVATGGEAACHLAVSPGGDQLVVVNYGSGSISSFLINSDGSTSERLDLLQFTGSGPDPERQEGPHAHQAVYDDNEILVPDLGTDRIHRIALSAAGAFSRAADPIRLPAGAGPRHLVRIEDYLVVACELSAEVWLARRTESGWEELSIVASTSATATTYPSAIVAEGDRIFVANRGPGTIGVFDLDRSVGSLTKVAEFPCGGGWPRDLTVRDGQLWVANERNHVVSVFSTDDVSSGTAEFEFSSPSPACIVLLDDQPTAIA